MIYPNAINASFVPALSRSNPSPHFFLSKLISECKYATRKESWGNSHILYSVVGAESQLNVSLSMSSFSIALSISSNYRDCMLHGMGSCIMEKTCKPLVITREGRHLLFFCDDEVPLHPSPSSLPQKLIWKKSPHRAVPNIYGGLTPRRKRLGEMKNNT